MAVWTDAAQEQSVRLDKERTQSKNQTSPKPAAIATPDTGVSALPVAAAEILSPSTWPVPSAIAPNPEEARAAIQLPEFDALMLEKARVISARYPMAEAEYRNLRGTEPAGPGPAIPHFERVFRIAAA